MKFKFNPITPEFAFNVSQRMNEAELARGFRVIPESSSAIAALGVVELHQDIERIKGEMAENEKVRTRLAEIMAETEELQRQLSAFIGE